MAGRGGGRGASGGRGVARSGPYPSSNGRGAGGGRGFGGGGGGGGGRGSESSAGAPVLPYAGGGVARSVAEHAARFPSRPVNEELTLVNAHWVSQAKGGTLAARPSLKAATESVTPTDAAEVDAKAGVNARAIILGTSAGRGKGAQVLGMREVGGGRGGGSAHAYGGTVKKGSDAAVTKQLAALVKGQSGIDLARAKWTKVIEFQYQDKPATVFYSPTLDGEEVEAKPIASETTEEYEDEEEYEVEEEVEVKDGDKTKKEMKKVTKTKTVKKERVKKDYKIRPIVLPLAAVRDQSVGKGTDAAVQEFCAAADAVDEWMRRDSASKLLPILEAKKKEEVAAEAERKKKQEERAAKKRKRDEELDAVKKAKVEKEEKMRADWKEADEGMTDEDKKKAKKERNEALQGLNTDTQKELSALREKFSEEDDKAFEASKPPAPEAGKPKTRKVRELDVDKSNLFAIFDRDANGSMSRDYFAKCLLALGDGMTLAKAQDLATHGGTARGSINYRDLCTIVKEVEIPPSPKKEEKKEEEKVEESAES